MPRAKPSTEDVTRSAALLMKRNQWRRALKLMDSVPRRKRTYELWWNHGWASGKLKDWKGAVRSLAAAVRVKPKSPVGLWALGLAHSEAGQPKLAERYHLAAIALKDSSLARLTLARSGGDDPAAGGVGFDDRLDAAQSGGVSDARAAEFTDFERHRLGETNGCRGEGLAQPSEP